MAEQTEHTTPSRLRLYWQAMRSSIRLVGENDLNLIAAGVAFFAMLSLFPALAALIAAVVSSLASMMNSISTIFTMDLYRPMQPGKPEQHYVTVGRISAFAAMVLALALAQPFLGGFESAFQTVQEYTGFIAPGVVVVFLLGFFDKKANTAGAFTALIGSLALNIVVALVGGNLPFVVRIWIVFLVALFAAMAVSRLTQAPEDGATVKLADIGFGTSSLFNSMAVLTTAILIGLYAVLW